MDSEAGEPSMVELGTRVQIGGGQHGLRSGTVRYCGAVAGKKGKYVGIELDYPIGKNDGSCEGYNCIFHHG